MPAEQVEDPCFPTPQPPVNLLLERGHPVGSAGRSRLLAEFGRQVPDLDGLAGRHYRKPVAEVFKLPHIPGEVES